MPEKFYYYVFSNGDPMRSSFKESEKTIEEMRTLFVGTSTRTGDEEHDFDFITDIWTEEQARKYYKN